jgi:hypothetical protein
VCFSFLSVLRLFSDGFGVDGLEGLRRAPNKNPIRLIFLNQDEDKKRGFASVLRAFLFFPAFLVCGMVEGG